MLRNKCLYGLALLTAAMLTINAYSATKNGHRSSARMSGSNAACANAEFEQVTVKGKVCKKLMITLDHAKPNRTYSVFVNDEKVGTISTNEKGKGKLDLRNASFMTDGCQRMRNGFPMLHKGDSISVGPLTGVFVDEDDDDGSGSGGTGGDTGGGALGYPFHGDLIGFGSTYGSVTYNETMDNGVLNRSFEITYADAIPMHLLFVAINGDVWVNLMTDANGQAHLLMQTNPPAGSTDVELMPIGFPSIQMGDVVSVGLGSAMMAGTPAPGGGAGSGDPAGGDTGSGDAGAGDDHPCNGGSSNDDDDHEHHDHGHHYAKGHDK